MGVRESCDHVNGDMRPGSFWYRIGMQWGCLGLGAGLRPLAGLATLDVGFHVFFDFGPPKFAEYEFLHLLDPWMTSHDMIMTLGDDFSSERGLSWDVYSSVIVQESFLAGYFSIVREGGCNACVPKFFLSGDFLNLSVYRVGGGHYECPEVLCLEDNNIIIISLPLVMVVALG